MKKIDQLPQKIIFTVFYLGALVILYKLGASCIFLKFLHIPCPGCGMTRALLSALRLDFVSAFNYHPLFWLFGPIVLYFLFYEEIRTRFHINEKLENAVMIGSMMLLLIVWVLRQFII